MTRINEIAKEILEYSRNNLLFKMPFLNKVLFSLKFKETKEMNFASDGNFLYYSATYIIQEYKEDDEYFIRALLHILLHYLFHHQIVDQSIDYHLWSLACDIAVENTINNLNLNLKNNNQEKQEEIIVDLSNKLSNLNAENIYRYYHNLKINDDRIDELRYYFFKDEHGLWYESDNLEIKKWDELSTKVQTDLETYHRGYSDSLAQSLSEVNHHKMTLKYFLSRFGAKEETMKISQDEMDIMLYSYGFSLYDNLALVENQEFKEEKQLKDLVLAIDTSGSVKGELVKKFIEYAYSILSDNSLLSDDLNLYLIQCDDKIEEVKHITSKKEIDDYLNHLELKGFGQTDFRPVFAYVNDLITSGQIKDLKGLLYFTDGKGKFPLVNPKYKTAFIIYQEKYEYINVPPWAMKIELMENDILDEKFK